MWALHGWEWGGKPPPRGHLGNWAELPAGNTREEAPQQRDSPSGWKRGHGWASCWVPRVCPLPHPPSRLLQQTCAVCLEDFKVKEELGVLPCQHAFHRK